MFKKATTALLLMSLSLLTVVTLETFLFRPQKLSTTEATAPVLAPEKQLLAIDAEHPLLAIHQMAARSPEEALVRLEQWRAGLTRPPEVIEQIFSLWVRRLAAKNESSVLDSIDSELNKIAKVHRLSWLLAKLDIESAYKDFRRGSYPEGITKIMDAIKFAEHIRADFLLLQAYNTAGALYNSDNQLKLSQKYFIKGVEVGRKYPESEYNVRFNNNLGLLYVHSEQWERAIEYLARAEVLGETLESIEPETKFIVLMNQSFVYNKLGKVNESREAFAKGIRYIDENTPALYRIIRLKSETRLLLLEGQSDKALGVAIACMNAEAIDKYPRQLGICQMEHAMALKDLGRFNEAREFIEASIASFTEIDHKRWLIRSHLLKANILEKQGEHVQALQVYQTYHEKERSQILNEIHNLGTAFEIQELERERDLLDLQNELKEFEQGLTEQRVRLLYIWLGFALLVAVWLVARWVAERKRNQYLHDLSFNDPLTAVGNRRFYQRELETPVVLDPKAVYRVTLVDIDRFKQINDNFGHEVGDGVLKEVTARIKSELQDHEVIVRWGGEEFLLAVSDGADYCERAQSLIAAVNKKPIVVGDYQLEVTISIGASEPYTLEGLRVSKRAFSIADECLYQAKERGRNQLVMPEEL
ncbi:GGDEF domain-containing protein [Vibrio sp. MarTm2]|uniref:tetratricopeptide repeat-containing diguanylate cyclase n=1 Tax=Vibrio sp. MarTm2 TaxID=2998831 RepID=UPI0022CDBA6B|nr:GGDEF domain-containing protein [Vibrio sp. MarTm2]MDA0129273.1 GGDEF domain-containing protein [Vibrio sp. MarTm2]